MARDRASRPEAKALRLFVAFDLPEPVKDSIERAIAPLIEKFPRARWVPRENWHVTVKFLGATYPRLLPWVEASIADITGERRKVGTSLTSLGSFPSSRRARVLWAGLDDRAGRLAEISLGLDAALSKEFRPEKRPFTPHLTVARSEPPLALSEGWSGQLEQLQFVVEEVILFRSYLRRPAPVYEPLRSFHLG
jgi:RNA 2',3'-cyclic 3'-phosphodiesterase